MARNTTLLGLIVALLVLQPSISIAKDPAKISGRAMGNCLIEASNTIIKLRPSFQLKMIHEPAFTRRFDDKNEVGQPIEVAYYRGKVDVVFAGRNAVQDYICTFWRDPGKDWLFSWTGLGGTFVEGYE